MRLDKFLQVSRLIKRRALANAFCDGGHVDINGRRAKAASVVAPGDLLALRFGDRIVTVRVTAVPAGRHARPDQGPLYEAVATAIVDDAGPPAMAPQDRLGPRA